jgi:lysophospholipase L1-like esterase
MRLSHLTTVSALAGLLAMTALSHAAAPLNSTLKKLKAGQDVTIGYFGGSITLGAGSSNYANSWRELTTKWFKDNYPRAQVTEINAAIGGTGSEFGAFRCEADLLSKKPDLVFVEFAVNDGGPADGRGPWFEGVIRQILKSDTHPDIVLVQTVTQTGAMENYEQGKPPLTVVTQDRIAAHYNLPAINVGKAAWEKVKAGELTWSEFAKDGVHPTDAGHKLYADILIEQLLPLLKSGSPRRANLPPPIYKDASSAWERVDEPLSTQYRWQWPHFVASDKPGTEFTHQFTGTYVGLYCQMGPDTGSITYSIDGGKPKTLSLFDTRYTYVHPGNFMLAEGLAPGKHTVRLVIQEATPAGSEGRWVRLGALLIR